MYSKSNILNALLTLTLCLAGMAHAQTVGGRRVFTRGNTRTEFKLSAEGKVEEVRTIVTKTSGGQVTGYEIVTHIPKNGANMNGAHLLKLSEELLDMPFGTPEGMLCVSIENGVLQEDADSGMMYMDIVVTDCDGNILRTERKQIAAAPAPEFFTIPEGSILNTPQQGEGSPDGT